MISFPTLIKYQQNLNLHHSHITTQGYKFQRQLQVIIIHFLLCPLTLPLLLPQLPLPSFPCTTELPSSPTSSYCHQTTPWMQSGAMGAFHLGSETFLYFCIFCIFVFLGRAANGTEVQHFVILSIKYVSSDKNAFR